MKKSFFISLTILLFYSCNNTKEDHKLIPSGEIVTFDIGFPVRHFEYFKENDQEFISFVDFTTHKKIKVFSLDNQIRKEIPFNEIMKNDNVSFHSFYPITSDSLALLSKYTSKVYLINSKGNVILKKDYSKYLLKGIEMQPPLKIKNSILRTGVGVFPPGNDTLSEIELNKIKLSHYVIVEDTAFLSKANQLSFRMNNLYNRFTKDDEWPIETTRFVIADNWNIFYSSYSDSLYIFKKDYTMDRVVKIFSSFYNMEIRPIKMTEAQKDLDLPSKEAWNKSMLWYVQYDSNRLLYYCFIRGPHIDREFPFSILVLDENFNKLTEKKFSQKEYKPRGFVAEEGFYLERQQDDFTKKTFELLNYE